MKSNRQARHILGLNYKLSNHKSGDRRRHETVIAHATGRKRHAGSKFPLMMHNTIGKTDGVFVYRLR
jgi:stationary-phase-induced ribosome-associated protein